LSQFTKPPISTNRPCFTGTGYIDSSGKKVTSENGLYNFCGEEEILREFGLKRSSVRANIQLEVCNPENEIFCIEEFTFESPEKGKTFAQFDRYVAETFFTITKHLRFQSSKFQEAAPPRYGGHLGSNIKEGRKPT
jgi:hypothetical protein